MSFASSSSKGTSKFKISCKFVVVNANAKCEAAVGSSESVNKAFVHLDFLLTLSQCSISTRLITPRVLNYLPFISNSLASFSPLQLTKITFVSFVGAEQNNRLYITIRYLYCLNLAKKLFTSLSLMLMSTGFILSYMPKFCSLPIFIWSIISQGIRLLLLTFFFFLADNIEKLVTLSSFDFINISFVILSS